MDETTRTTTSRKFDAYVAAIRDWSNPIEGFADELRDVLDEWNGYYKDDDEFDDELIEHVDALRAALAHVLAAGEGAGQ